MYGQSRDQGSDASTGSRTEPAFFQSPPPVSGSNRSGNRQQTKPAPNRRPGLKPEIPEVGNHVASSLRNCEGIQGWDIVG